MKKVLFTLLIAFFFSGKAQDFLGLQSSNYAGVTGAISNPASIADSRYVVDIALFGANVNVDNNYIGFNRKNLRSITDSTFKEKLHFINNGKNKELVVAGRLVLPSFLITLNQKSALALNIGLRNYINFHGLTQDLADLALNEFSLNSLLNKRLTNNNLSLQQAAWVEYGLTYARVLKNDNEHFFKAGITPKLLQGLEAMYIHVRKLDYLVSNKDTFSFFNSSLAYGYSDNLDGITFDESVRKNAYKYKPVYGMGLDMGMVYEWRPDHKSYKYNMDGKTNLWRRDKNKYRLKAGFSLLDIGRIKFSKGRLSNEVEANVTRFNMDRFENADDLESLDSTLRKNFSVQASPDLKIVLPTAINMQVDYHIWKPFYLNFTANITNLQKKRESRIYEYSLVSIAPRFEHKWFGLTVPVSFNRLSAQRERDVLLGAMLRLGPLVIGTNDLPAYFSKYMYGASFYALLKLPVPYGHKRDRDKDEISDKIDKCKTEPGIWEFMGCPDRDKDHVMDSEDHCPDVPGLKAFKGCPDKDLDGITDAEDACPDSAGAIEFKGCPDRDGDKIIDRLDACPDNAGLKQFKGCPDKDLDGTPDKDDDCPDTPGPKQYKGCPDKDGDKTIDKEDACPTLAGPLENKGCPWPDTDKDGVLDKEDSCLTLPGLAEYKGCPPPIKAAEKKIIEKAYTSLEFATGKDIIKAKSLPSLKQLAELLILHEAEWTLKLSGHTDNVGSEEANLLLSEKRAKAVKKYLVKRGVKDKEIIVEWFGQNQPIADNETAKGRQLNRRVEMKVSFTE